MLRRPTFHTNDFVAALTTTLAGEGAIARVSDRDDDAQLWVDCELASYVANRFHQTLDPAALEPASREAWISRAVARDERIVDPRGQESFAACWILDGAARVGTISFQTYVRGHAFAPVYSLFVFPAHRARGHAVRTLRRVHELAVAAGGSGIRLATYWSWQAAVRRYLLSYRMWAVSFKRSVDFAWAADLPPHAIAIDADGARFGIERDGGTIELITAARDGDRLVWTEPEADVAPEIRIYARSTFAVALALHAWPLVRGREKLDAAAGHDLGGPELLARKIATFEYFDRQNGFEVRCPRIPGLPYAELEAELARDGS